MSAVTTRGWLDNDRGGRARSAPVLRPVPSELPRLSRLPFLLVLASLLGVGMVGLLVLNTQMQQQSFALQDKQQQATALAYTQAELQAQVDQARTPAQIASRAADLGMRPNLHQPFLFLPDGRVVGDTHKASGKDARSTVHTPAEIEAARKAAEAKQKKAQAEREAAEAKEKAKAAAQKKKAEAEKKKAEAEKKQTEAEKKKQQRSDERG